MTKKIVDARGLPCPRPLVMTKKALAESEIGEEFAVLLDNQTSQQNVERFLRDNNARVTTTAEDGIYTLFIVKLGEKMPHPDEQAYCDTGVRQPHAVCVKSDRMGIGDDALGGILMKAFINTLKDAPPLPATLIFYNNGIHLAVEGSPVLDALRDLEGRGVRILVCGTCLDYFRKRELLRVGIVSNMYDITQSLTDAGHVIYP